ncbi:MAG: type IV pilus twitching motility protein PilT [Caldiserica bacterium]|nr:type IV pilus twitching motility protein PilT [Caldisericota bacterium]
MDIREVLRLMVEKDASDLHIKAGTPPVFRIDGDLVPIGEKLSPEETREMAYMLLGEKKRKVFEDTGDLDTSYGLPGVGRFRVNTYLQRGTVGLAIRRVKTEILSFEELHLPPILKKLSLIPRGLVLICGAAGEGKSTTMASMIEYINQHRKCHVVTIEDPIEFLFHDKNSIVSQREIGLDTESFFTALRHVIRQDPDVIMIGELRDEETFRIAVNAAETGHLVLSSLHATDSSQVVNRILDFFPPEQHYQIRSQLASNLKGAIVQRLCKKKDGGVIPAVEVMIVNLTIARLIRENRVERIPQAIQGGKDEGMQTFNQSLIKLIKDDLITLEEGMAKSSQPEMLEMALKGIVLDENKQILGEF